jgi:hypothetical protein
MNQHVLPEIADHNGRFIVDEASVDAGVATGRLLARRLQSAGLQARIVALPSGQDPNSYFAAGATASDFVACMEHAQSI